MIRNKIEKVVVFTKNIILLLLGLFFLLGAITMIKIDITGTIFYGTISIICLFFSRDIIINYLQKIKKESFERQQDDQEIKARTRLKLKKIKLNNELEAKKAEIEYKEKIRKIEEKTKVQEYKIIPLTDLQCKITIEKIQELYKELGYNVKVIDIIKNKYMTEYEVIFSRDISQYEIMSISNKIIEKFSIDGTRIIRDRKNDNRIFIQIPLKYEETLT